MMCVSKANRGGPKNIFNGGRKSQKHLPRPRIQRAFIHWLSENFNSFAVPIIIAKITAKGIELRFENYPELLTAWISRNGLSVHVEWQGDWWDMLIDLDAWINHTPDGYKCKCCRNNGGGASVTFPSREAIWKDHLFDQLLKWVNEKLAPARWLRLSGTGGKGNRGITWAWLISDESELDELDRELIHLKGFKPLGGIRTYEYDVGYVRNWLIELRPETK